MPTVRENLIAAKALIDTPEKWGREEYRPKPGCFCAIGALSEVMGETPGSVEAHSMEGLAIARALPDGWEKHGWYVPNFNDAETTTHADIMALFQRAIDAEENTNG